MRRYFIFSVDFLIVEILDKRNYVAILNRVRMLDVFIKQNTK